MGRQLRRLTITKMVNGGIGLAQIMATARHTIVAASVAYEGISGNTLAKLSVLGAKPTVPGPTAWK